MKALDADNNWSRQKVIGSNKGVLNFPFLNPKSSRLIRLEIELGFWLTGAGFPSPLLTLIQLIQLLRPSRGNCFGLQDLTHSRRHPIP